MLDGCIVGIVYRDHLGVALDCGLGALNDHSQWSIQHVSYKSIIGYTLYLASKDDDLLDDSGSLILEELLNDVAADGTGPNDGEFGVSRHELILSTVSLLYPHPFIYFLSEP
jgi:hypothetical protein